MTFLLSFDKLGKNYWTQNKFMLSFHKGLKIIIPPR